MTKRKPFLFIPGPVMVTDRIRNSLGQHDISHRGQAFMDLLLQYT